MPAGASRATSAGTGGNLAATTCRRSRYCRWSIRKIAGGTTRRPKLNDPNDCSAMATPRGQLRSKGSATNLETIRERCLSHNRNRSHRTNPAMRLRSRIVQFCDHAAPLHRGIALCQFWESSASIPNSQFAEGEVSYSITSHSLSAYTLCVLKGLALSCSKVELREADWAHIKMDQENETAESRPDCTAAAASATENSAAGNRAPDTEAGPAASSARPSDVCPPTPQ